MGKELKSSQFYWIRQDWLDKLGLEAPTTVDELHDVLTAFKNNDPNGNGQADEIPLFDRSATAETEMGEYLALWDSSASFYPRDGKITYEPLTENYKNAVKNLAQWYKEGLIDPEIFTRGDVYKRQRCACSWVLRGVPAHASGLQLCRESLLDGKSVPVSYTHLCKHPQHSVKLTVNCN